MRTTICCSSHFQLDSPETRCVRTLSKFPIEQIYTDLNATIMKNSATTGAVAFQSEPAEVEVSCRRDVVTVLLMSTAVNEATRSNLNKCFIALTTVTVNG